MSKTPFMPLWVGDFLAKTGDLDAKEVGAYLLLLMSMWSRDGSLPADQKKLQRVARVGRDWPKVWAAIERYFTVEDGRIFNARLSEEMRKVNTKREVNAHAGARGGRAKALKDNIVRIANAKVSLCQSEPYPERETEDACASSVSATPKRGRKSRIPADWTPSEKDTAFAAERGLSEREIFDEADKFRDHHVARGSAFADHAAAWRTWVRNAIDYRARRGGMAGATYPSGGGGGSSLAAAAARRLAGMGR